MIDLLLTQCSLVIPYGDIELGQHWPRWWLVDWRHHAITWTNVDLPSVQSSDINLGAISQGKPQTLIAKFSLKITHLKFHSNLPKANELTHCKPLTPYGFANICRQSLLPGDAKPLPEPMLNYHQLNHWDIRLEGPEDPDLRNSSFGGHVTALTLQYLWPRPPGVWLGGPGCKPGHSGRS